LLGEAKLLAAIGDRKNVTFAGEYLAPVDLPAIYSQVHFNWCVDLDDGDNSLWLLPNRLYEGGYFGIPAIAVTSHETGRIVRQRHLGLSVGFPIAEQLCALLSKMSWDDYVKLREQIESLPASHFVDTNDIERLIESVSPVNNPINVRCSAAELQHKGVGQNG
jgi:succinoglycan biosynthesis protein ExoL